MKLPVFLAFCIALASSLDVHKIRAAGRPGYVEPHFSTNEDCACTEEPVPQCGCCYGFQLEQEDHNVCMNITLVKDEKALRFTVVFDGKVLVNKTVSATNPPPFCQGIKPAAYICEKYYNMSYGDDNKWGGCLEIYGGVVVQILDIKFGCFYLPVDGKKMNEIAEEPVAPPLATRFKNILKESLAEEFQRWYETKFGNKGSQRRDGKKSEIMLKNILFKNDGDESDGIEVPDMF